MGGQQLAAQSALSLRALGSIAIDQRDIPAHKVVVWIGPGWPVIGGDIGFDEATELSTRLREARITLDNVNVWPNPEQSFNYHHYLEAPRSQKDMQLAKMALQVIATHTEGLVLDSSGDLNRDIERCVEEVRSFYILTFNPPHTSQMDEFHELACRWIVLPSRSARPRATTTSLCISTIPGLGYKRSPSRSLKNWCIRGPA
jgi:hypothetical protein